MNPNSGESQLFETPKAPEYSETTKEQAVETRPARAESAPGKNQAPSLTPPPPSSPQPPVGATIPASTTLPPLTNDATATSLVADDVDLIEKQWVERAKAIVAQTQDDPYRQKEEISKTGAEYIKKRFNKTIPTDDTVVA